MSSPIPIQSLHAILTGIRLPIGMTVDQITLGGEGLAIDYKKRGLAAATSSSVVATVGEANLREFISAQLPEQVKEVSVFIGQGLIKIHAKAVVIFPINVEAICALVIKGDKIFIDVQDVSPGGPVRGIIEDQISKNNPIIEADDFPLPIAFDSIEMEDGAVKVYAHLLVQSE